MLAPLPPLPPLPVRRQGRTLAPGGPWRARLQNLAAGVGIAGVGFLILAVLLSR